MSVEDASLIETIVNLCLFFIRITFITLNTFVLRFFNIETTKSEDDKSDALHKKIMKALDISDIAQAMGYVVREHIICTKDGYILVAHKLEKSGISNMCGRKVVYFHHGLMTNSELFLLGECKEKSLPFLLVDLGYDVWLGNNRGNKYSRKHSTLSIRDPEFWDFSLDEYALYDIPDTINYILSLYMEGTKLTYVGFSQGCSQLFASLSLNSYLNEKINLFVGLSPAVVPQNLNHPVFRMIVKESASNNRFLYSIFGTRAILPSVSFWSYLLGPELYETVVDKSLVYLFGWSGKNISKKQKKLGYPHMFSNTSVKSLVHWFQIVNARRFQMFEETSSCGRTYFSTLTAASRVKGNRVAPFPIAHHLDVPMILFYGDCDILVDIEGTKRLILEQNDRMRFKLIDMVRCPGYEHMDVLWGNDVYEDVFKKAIDTIESIHGETDTLTNNSSVELSPSQKIIL